MVKKILIIMTIMTVFSFSPSMDAKGSVSNGSQNHLPEKIDPIHPTK